MIFNKNLPTSMRVVGAKVVRAFASAHVRVRYLFALCSAASGM